MVSDVVPALHARIVGAFPHVDTHSILHLPIHRDHLRCMRPLLEQHNFLHLVAPASRDAMKFKMLIFPYGHEWFAAFMRMCLTFNDPVLRLKNACEHGLATEDGRLAAEGVYRVGGPEGLEYLFRWEDSTRIRD